MSEHEFVCELSEPTQIFNHMQYYKADVIKWRITRPSHSSWGFFWDEETENIAFFPNPSISETPIVSYSQAESTLSLESPKMFIQPEPYQIAPVFAGLTHDSGQQNSNPELYDNAQRYITLYLSAFSGALHTVDVGTHPDDPLATVEFSRLAVDTGSSLTWIFGQSVELIEENPEENSPLTLERRGRKSWYVSGARKIPEVHGKLSYADGSRIRYDLYNGPFYLKGQSSLSNNVAFFQVCRVDSFIFGVATAASSHFEKGRMDGILGLGALIHPPVGGHIEPGLFVNCLLDEARIEHERFTLALGRSNQNSFLVIGENSSSISAVISGGWTRWMPTVSGLCSWALHLRSITIAGERCEVDRSVLLDSGTAYSYLPVNTCDWLSLKLNGKLDASGRGLYPRDQLNTMVEFNFDPTSTLEIPLDRLLDHRHCTYDLIDGKPATYGLFKPGSISELRGTGTGNRTRTDTPKPYILGNFFLRGILVEFERSATNESSGRIRLACRKRA